MRSKLLAASSLAALAACATVPSLTPAGAKVRQITPEEAKQCHFLQAIAYTDTIAGTGKSPGLVHQVGDVGLRNAVGTAGGNAFVSMQADADWFWGHVNYSGEAYKCSQ